MAKLTERIGEEKEKWFSFKNEVKKAHWDKVFNPTQRGVLSINPWQFIQSIRNFENEIVIAQAKHLYYIEIFKTQATPSVRLDRLKKDIYHLMNGHGSL